MELGADAPMAGEAPISKIRLKGCGGGGGETCEIGWQAIKQVRACHWRGP